VLPASDAPTAEFRFFLAMMESPIMEKCFASASDEFALLVAMRDLGLGFLRPSPGCVALFAGPHESAYYKTRHCHAPEKPGGLSMRELLHIAGQLLKIFFGKVFRHAFNSICR
jgi:hypothetical protein